MKRIDRDAETWHYRQLNHWLDEAYAECERNGGFDNLPGAGKPLTIPDEDVLQTIMRNANVKHPWIVLRQEVRAELELAMELADQPELADEFEALLRSINEKIVQLNVQAPSISLHRRKITKDNLKEQYGKWL